MASVLARRLKHGEVWYARVKLRSGSWYLYNTGIAVERDGGGDVMPRSRAKGMRAANELQAAEKAGMDPFGLNIEKREGPSLSEAIAQYLRERSLSWAAGTSELQRATFRELEAFLGDRQLHRIDRAEVVCFRDHLHRRGARGNTGRWLRELSNSTLNIHLRNLNAFWNWCARELDLRDWRPPILGQARMPTGEANPYYRPDEIRRLMEAAGTVRQNGRPVSPFVAFAILTGMRRNEILAFDRMWLRASPRIIVIPGRLTKSLRGRQIPVEEELGELLEGLRAWGGQPFDMFREDISKKVRRAENLAGLPPLKLHALRDTAAIRWLMVGRSLQAVKQLLGHASIETTEEHYTRLQLADLMGDVETRADWIGIGTAVVQAALSDC